MNSVLSWKIYTLYSWQSLGQLKPKLTFIGIVICTFKNSRLNADVYWKSKPCTANFGFYMSSLLLVI